MAHFRAGSLHAFGWYVAASGMGRIGMAEFLELSPQRPRSEVKCRIESDLPKEELHIKPRKENTMTRLASRLLDTNDSFPEMDLHLISGETLGIPRGLGDGYSVVLLYRGYW